MLACIIVLGVSACSFLSSESAYDIAVRNGFSGTETEWLESLKGEQGEQGPKGADGIDGTPTQSGTSVLGSAKEYTVEELYAIAVENGYTKTLLEFIKEYYGADLAEQNSVSSVVNAQVFACCVVTARCMDATTSEEYRSSGSGVFYTVNKTTGDALIITNFHVVYDESATTTNYVSSEIYIYLYGDFGNTNGVRATYVGGTADYDIALLSVSASEVIKNSNSVAATFANSDDVCVGETVVAIGNPRSQGFSATTGIISVDSETITLDNAKEQEVKMRLLRTDAPINSGNSGGGLFDLSGKLIGIVNAKIIESTVENIGYAIPSNVVAVVVDLIMDYCYNTSVTTIKRPIIGMSVRTNSSYGQYNSTTSKLEIIEEVVVVSTSSDGIVGNKLQADDVIKSISIGGVSHTIKRSFQVIDLLMSARPGDKVIIGYTRETISRTVTLTITEACMTSVN